MPAAEMVTEELGVLSERELEVLKLVATGATNQQIARELVISPNTVKVHLRNVFEKLGVQSRTEATMEAVRRGWVAVGENAVVAAAGTDAAPSAAAQPISLLELMPQAPARTPVARWQHAYLVLALLVTTALVLLPTWWRGRSEAGGLSPFSDAGRSPVAAPARVDAQRWTAGALLPQPRSRLAVATDGLRLYAIGGETQDGVTDDLLVYDPVTNGWLPLANKPTPAANIAAAYIDGRIYVPGGSTADGGVTQVMEVYDVAADTWTAGTALPAPLSGYALAAWDGALYLFGGWDGTQYRAETWILQPGSGEGWREGAALPGSRALAAAASHKGIIYVIGGYDGRVALRDVLAYDPRAADEGRPTLAVKTPLQQPRAGLAAVGVGVHVFALGGSWNADASFNEQYDTRLDAWSRLGTPMAGQWRNLAAAPLNNKIYAVGGWSGTYLDVNEQYLALIQQLIPFTGTG